MASRSCARKWLPCWCRPDLGRAGGRVACTRMRCVPCRACAWGCIHTNGGMDAASTTAGGAQPPSDTHRRGDPGQRRRLPAAAKRMIEMAGSTALRCYPVYLPSVCSAGQQLVRTGSSPPSLYCPHRPVASRPGDTSASCVQPPPQAARRDRAAAAGPAGRRRDWSRSCHRALASPLPVRAAVPLPAAERQHARTHRRAVIRRVQHSQDAAHLAAAAADPGPPAHKRSPTSRATAARGRPAPRRQKKTVTPSRRRPRQETLLDTA